MHLKVEGAKPGDTLPVIQRAREPAVHFSAGENVAMGSGIIDHTPPSKSREKDAKKKKRSNKTDKMERKSESISRWEDEGGAVLPTEKLPPGQQTPVKEDEDSGNGK